MKPANDFHRLARCAKPISLAAGLRTETITRRMQRWSRLALLLALTLVLGASTAIPAVAADANQSRPPITLASLVGQWHATLFITGGCGVGTKLLIFTINPSGAGLATEKFHTQTCGDNTITGSFTITSLNSDGAGTAQLIMTGVTFNFDIQVAASGELFNMVDITDTDNYEEGTAIRQ